MRRSGFGVGVVAGALTLSLLASCGGTPTGTVAGVFRIEGGPPGVHVPLRTGTIYLASDSRQPITVNVQPGGNFTVQVPVGTYTVTGRTRQVNGGKEVCDDNFTVIVHSGQLSTTTVACQIR